MGKKSRDKGARGELEFAAELRERGIDAHRGRQYSGGRDSPDVKHALNGFHFEVKRAERLQLYPAWHQAMEDSPPADIPVVAHRRNGKPWLVALALEDFLDLVELARMMPNE